ncbi:MAG: SPOR domain-containing protein [Thermodesulfobacteriota bacterium]
MNLVLVLLMALAGASLAGALLFLYRWLVRRRLFPQLPRIWGVDRLRFIILGAVFLALAAAWLVLAVGSRPAPPAPAPAASPRPAPPAAAPPSASGDGETYFPLPHRSAAPGDERALPPASEPSLPAPETPGGVPAWATVTSLTAASTATTSQTTTSSETTTTTSATTTLATTTSLTTTQTTAAPSATTATTAATQTTASSTTTTQPPAKPAPAGAAVYTVSLGSHKQEAAAKAHAARLAAQGLKSEVVAVDLGAKGRWWRVYAGQFPDPASAQAQAKAWEKQGLATTPFPVRRR